MYHEAPLSEENCSQEPALRLSADFEPPLGRDGEREYTAYFAEYCEEYTLPVCHWE